MKKPNFERFGVQLSYIVYYYRHLTSNNVVVCTTCDKQGNQLLLYSDKT